MLYITWEIFKFWTLMISPGVLWYYNLFDNSDRVQNIQDQLCVLWSTVFVVSYTCFQIYWTEFYSLDLVWSLLTYDTVLSLISGQAEWVPCWMLQRQLMLLLLKCGWSWNLLLCFALSYVTASSTWSFTVQRADWPVGRSV